MHTLVLYDDRLYYRIEIRPRQKSHKSDGYGGTTGRQQYYTRTRAPEQYLSLSFYLSLSLEIRWAFKTVYTQCIVT